MRMAAVAGVAALTLASGGAGGASNVVRYTYDAAGNVVAIRRVDAAPVTLAAFSPPSGPRGTVVTIAGTGFSATPSGNAVSFGGAAAIVTGATATTLTATVPTDAVTGPVAVRVAGAVATSAQDFVVTAPGAPTIAAFAPAAGPAGTRVIVTGTNFAPAAGATTVKLNQNAATAASVTATELAFTVPAATGSGRIRVSTALGSALSDADFIVPPGTIAAGDVIATRRLVADGPAQSLGLFAADKYGLLLFDGNASDWLSLQFASFAINPAGATIAYTVFRPDNKELASGSLSAATLSVHLPPLPASGTYAVLLGSGRAQLSVDARVESNRLVPADGSKLAVARTAGQTTRALIAALAGERKALMISGMSTIPAGTTLDVSIRLPGGSTFRQETAFGAGTTFALPPYSVTGTHAVVLTPGRATAQARYDVALLAGTPLPADGPGLDVAIANPGEGARLNFAGVAGENLGFGIRGLALSPASAGYVRFSVYQPDATLLASGNCWTSGTECAANLTRLPVTGSYSIIVQPAYGATGTLQAWLSHDAQGTLTSGSPYGLALARPGQNGRLAFAGTAGEPIALQVRGVTTAPAGQGLLVLVARPDGPQLAYMHLTGTGQTLVAPPLPVTGTYTVFVEPEPGANGAATAAMEILLDPGRALVADGPTQSASIAGTGASARFTFAALAGQNLGLGIGNLALSPAVDASVTVYRPDGTELTAITCSRTIGGCGANLAGLPKTGTYGIVVQPAGGATGTFDVTLTSDATGDLAVDAPLTLALARPGQNGRLTFAANAGDIPFVALSRVVTQPPGQFVYLTLRLPNGTSFASTATSTPGSGLYGVTLPATGNYQLVIDPINHSTAGLTITRLGAIPLTVDGTPVVSTLDNPGDARRFTFAGTAGQTLSLGVGGMTTSPNGAGHQLTVYGPTGQQVGAALCYAQYGGCSVDLVGLRTTGSHSVIVQSTQGGTGRFAMALSTILSGTLTVGGAAFPLDLDRPGRNALLNFAGTAGQTLRLSWSGVTVAGTITSVPLYINRPDGPMLRELQLVNGVAGSYDIPVLPLSGNYTVFIDPLRGTTMNASLTLAPR